MNVACPHRHFSYSRWRLQTFRGLFWPQHLQDTLQGAAGRIPNPPRRIGDGRNFTASPATSGRGRKQRASKNRKGEDEDAMAFLEDAARRTTSPQVIDPGLSLRPTPPPSHGSDKRSQQNSMSPPTPANNARQNGGSKKGRRPARTPAKTQKQIEEDEAAAFLEEATKRVTGLPGWEQFSAPADANARQGKPVNIPPKPQEQILRAAAAASLEVATKRVNGLRMSEQLTAPVQPRKSSKSAPKTQKQMDEENAAFLREIRTHINYRRMSSLLNDPPQLRVDSPGALMKRNEADEEEAVAFAQEATRLANRDGFSELRTSSARRPEDTAGPKQNTTGKLASSGGPGANPNARLSAAIERVTGRSERKFGEGHVTDNSSAAELQNWFKEAVNCAPRHERRLEVSASNRDPHPNLHQTPKGRVPHPQEPWTFRASRRSMSTMSSKAGPSGGNLQVEFERQQSLFGANEEIQDARITAYAINSDQKTDGTRTMDPESASAEGRNSVSEPEIPRIAHGSSVSIEENMLSSSESFEGSSSSPVPVVRKRPSGILSSLEHEQLSSLLSSLRSGDLNTQNPEQRVEVRTLSESLPKSPYQRLQAKERRIKEQATAEAKQRLKDNPWAEWLASPVRMCQATGVRLPNKLMVGWNYVRNPKDDQVYLMPEELANMTQLDKGARIGSSPRRTSAIANFQRTASHGSAPNPNVKDTTITDASADSPHSKDAPNVKAQGCGSQSSTVPEATADPPKGKPPMAAAKLHMRPSSILLEELGNRMLATGERMTKTSPGTVNRLLPNRWKDQARKFEKSADAKTPQAEFLTMQEMRKVQWHPNINSVMLNLLRSRILKALESAAVRNSHKAGIHRRIIPLPLAESDSFDENAVTATLSGIEQAVFLWLGAEGSSGSAGQHPHSHIARSSLSPPPSPLTCHSSTLRFMPRIAPPAWATSPSGDAADKSQEAFVPVWTHNACAANSNQANQTIQDQYIPPSISVHLPHDITTNNTSAANPTTRSLPVFDLPTLLGSSAISTLHTLAQDNPDIREAFGLTDKDRDKGGGSGWVIVKGGDGTSGLKNLVQEVWRLWLFVGGRRGGVEDV